MAKQKRKEKETASFFQELGGFMRPYLGLYGGSVLLSILGVAVQLTGYGLAGLAAARMFQQEFDAVWPLALGAVACKLGYGILLNSSTWLSHRAAYPTLRDIRKALADKLMRLPLGYFEEQGSGRLKTMLAERVESMEKTLAHLLPEMTANLFGPAAMLVWLFVVDWRLALCSLIWVLLGFSVTGGMMVGYEEKYAGQIAADKAMNQAVVEYVGGIEVIKNFGQAEKSSRKFREAVFGHANYNINWFRETQLYAALGMAVAPFSVFPVLFAGLLFFRGGTLEAADLVLAVLLTLGIFTPLMNAMGYFDQLAQMGTDAKEIRTVLEWPELKRGSREEVPSAEVAFSHVTFSYEKSREPALQDISLRVPAGTMLALVGPSGSGKSTIAKLLAGYWDADSGRITLGGIPLQDFSQEALNRAVASVDQETFLFDTTILENIRMGNPKATDNEVIEAARKAGCDDFIRALPQGYNTEAGSAGGRLSGGERQRIAIARAMLKDAPIMILDEATASSDPENEAAIQKALSAAAREKTLIVVAHRLATVMDAQQIAFVKQGRITAIGTHEQLLESCPDYAHMWALSEEV